MVSTDPKVTGDAEWQSSRIRRVRFAIDTGVRELTISEDDHGSSDRRRHTILPGEDEDSRMDRAEADKQLPPEPEGPIRALDPALAATRRARLRSEALSRMQLLEDTSMPDDLAAAEEEYDEPEELFNEGGIPIEPFHLRAEREEGYFDAEGNYLEYRLEAEDTDAWLESIMDEHRQVRADPGLVAQRRKATAAAMRPTGSVAAADGTAATDEMADDKDDDDDNDENGPYDMQILEDTGPVLEEDERALYQKRVADLLLLGEVPLEGLRRLGKVMHGAGTSAAAGGVAPAAMSLGVTAPGTTADVAHGTSAADVGGATDVYSTAAKADGGGGGRGGVTAHPSHLSCGERQRLRRQRRQQRMVAQQHEQGNVVAAMGAALTAEEAVQQRQGDGRHGCIVLVEALDLEMGEVVAGSEVDPDKWPLQPVVVVAEQWPGDEPPSPPARQSVAEAAAAAAARRRAPSGLPSEAALEARRQFDSLTSYANLLLSAGMYDVYNTTREQLLRAAQRTLGVDVVRSLTVAGQKPVGQSQAPKQSAKRTSPVALVKCEGHGANIRQAGGETIGLSVGGGGEATGKRIRPMPEAAYAACEARPPASELISSGSSVAVGGAGDDGDLAPAPGGLFYNISTPDAAAVDADMDMFAEGGGSGADVAPGLDSTPASGGDAIAAPRPALQGLDYGGDASTRTYAGDWLLEDNEGGGQCGSATAALTEETHGSILASGDFVLDSDSGYMYSSSTGFYYDKATGLYGDANTGLWCRRDPAAESHDSGVGGDDGRLGSMTVASSEQQQLLVVQSGEGLHQAAECM